MIALLLGLALADPCAREVVIGRGLVATEPGTLVAREASLDLRLVIRSRRVDGIRAFYVRHARLDWSWTLSTPHQSRAASSVGRGDALCEGEVREDFFLEMAAGEAVVEHRLDARDIDACRVRVVLKGTIPEAPTVRLEVVGAKPPGPDAPVDGPVAVTPGSDLVIDVPACL